MTALTVIVMYLSVMNILVLIMMRIDKSRSASRSGRRRRIPERRLLGFAALGGSLGGWLAMRLFRHKTKHAAFAIGLPAMTAVHAVLLAILLYYTDLSAYRL